MTATNMISTAALRTILRTTYGDRKYRIMADGAVHAYMTPMTNTNQDGWAFIGFETELRREYATR